MIIIKKPITAAITMRDLNFIEDDSQDVAVAEPQIPAPSQIIQKPVPSAKIQTPEAVQAPTPVVEPISAQPTIQSPTSPAPVPLTLPESQITNPALNKLLSEGYKRVGWEEGVTRRGVPDAFPDDILEKMLNVKLVGEYGGQTVEQFLVSKFTKQSDVDKSNEYIIPTHEDAKGRLNFIIISKMLSPDRQRGWDLQSKIMSHVNEQQYIDSIQDKKKHVSTVKNRINQLDKEGIPLRIQEMFPMPPADSWSSLKQKNVMEPRIHAEQLSEAFKQKAWEYGKEPVNEKGEIIKSGEKGSRTYAAFEELNRVYDILSRTKTDYWNPPSNMTKQIGSVFPYEGRRAFDKFEYMKKLLYLAMVHNEKTGGKLAESINSIIKPNGPINLDRSLWSRGHQFYSDYSMVDPIREHIEPFDFYDALMSGRKGGVSMDLRGEEGGLVREYSGKYEGFRESEEDAKERRDPIKKVNDPLMLIKNPLVTGEDDKELPTKRKFTVPNASQKIYESMFPKIRTKADLQERVNKLLEDPVLEKEESDLTPEEKSKEVKINQEINLIEKTLMSLPEHVDVGKAYEQMMSGSSGITTLNIENVMNKMLERKKGEGGIALSPLKVGPKGIENFIRENGLLPSTPDDSIKGLSENIFKVLSNFNKIRSEIFKNKKDSNDLILATLPSMEQKYLQNIQSPPPQNETESFIYRTKKMESEVKLLILKFIEDGLKGATNKRSFEKTIMDDMGKRRELSSVYTQKELDTGKVMLSTQNNLAIQRLDLLSREIASEILGQIYEIGKRNKTLEAKVLHQIRVALFLFKNHLSKIG